METKKLFKKYYKDKNEFLSTIKSELENYNIEDLISEFKIIGVGINEFSNPKIESFIIELEKIFNSVNMNECKQNILTKYIDDIRLFNSFYYESFNSKEMKLIEEQIKQKSFFPLFFYLQDLNYNYINIIKYENFEAVLNSNKNIVEIGCTELINSYYNDYLKYLTFNLIKINFNNKNFKIAFPQEEITCRQLTTHLVNRWRIGGIEIISKSTKYMFKIIDKEKLFFIESSDYNYMSKRNEDLENNYIKSTQEKIRLSEQELKDTFCVNDLNTIEVNKISIYNWLKAFCIIIENYGNKKNEVLFTTKEKIIKKFIENGINRQNAEEIIKYIIFNSNCEDFFDAPFFSIYSTKHISWFSKIAFIPALISQIYPCRSVLAVFSKNRFKLEDKGENFEHYLSDYLQKYGISSLTITKNFNKATYQCDLVFIMDNNLYLCELKNKGANFSNHKFFENYYYLDEYVMQSKRIFDFLLSKPETIESQFLEKFDLKINVSEMLVHKIVIYNHFLGKNFEKEDIISTDIYNIRKYFESNSKNLISLNDYLKRDEFFENTKKAFSIEENEATIFDKKLIVETLMRKDIEKMKF